MLRLLRLMLSPTSSRGIMPSVKHIVAKYSRVHDQMAAEFYLWERLGLVDAELQDAFTESHEENELAKQAELKTASDYVEPKPPRDLEGEMDELRAEIKELKKA